MRRVIRILTALTVAAGIAAGSGFAVPGPASDASTAAPLVAVGRAPIWPEGEEPRTTGGPRTLPGSSTSPSLLNGSGTPPLAAEPAVAAPDADALRAALDRARWAYGIYGVQLGVATARGDWTVVSGVARDAHTPLTTEAPSAIGSVTKTFVAAVVLSLAEDGRLALDDAVSRYLPQLPIAREVTIRQLLSHTSGVADLFGPMQAALTSAPERAYTPAEVLRLAGPAWFSPGAGFAYSNTNYVILGQLIEKVTGQPVARVLDERLFEPLGLTSASLGEGIGEDERQVLQKAWATSFWTSGAITASARDLARWGADLYGGRVLEPSSLTHMTTFSKDDYGLGAQRLQLGDETAYGHSGLIGTYTSLLVYLPREQVTVAVLANRAEVDLASFLLYREAAQPSLLDLALQAAPQR